MKYLEIGYNDVMIMPTNERRFYLGLLVKGNIEQQERSENSSTTTGGKGTKKTKFTGDALKNQLKSGKIPLK